MKSSTLNDYAQRIDRAIQFLTESLADDAAPSLQELADAAALSKYHFHRIFRLMTGETVNEAVRRIRLARGVFAAQRAPMASASGTAAYATSQSFARSMRSFTGMSTSEIVKSADIATLFSPPAGQRPLTIEIVELQPLQLVAMRNRGDYAELDEVFGSLFEIAGGPEQVRAIFGFYLSDPRYEPANDCEFVAGLHTARSPQSLGRAHIVDFNGGVFLRGRHSGNYDDIPLALDELTIAAIEGGHVIRDEPPLVQYLDDPEEIAIDELRCDVHLPVEAFTDSAPTRPS